MPIQRLHSVLIRPRTDQGNEKALMGAYSGNFGFSAHRGLDSVLRIVQKFIETVKMPVMELYNLTCSSFSEMWLNSHRKIPTKVLLVPLIKDIASVFAM